MKRFKRMVCLIFVLILLFASVLSTAAFAETAVSGGDNGTVSMSVVSGASESKPNVLGIICWIVIGLGILFIVYVLLSSNKKNKKSGLRPKQLKYRRSPYGKSHRRMEEEYYKYKRNKYK